MTHRFSLGIVLLAGSAFASPVLAAPLRVMTMGDSLTYGYQYDNSPHADEGGYRPTFYNKLTSQGSATPSWQAAGLTGVDMIGSLQDGPATGGFDSDHEGHSGIKIGGLAAQASSILQDAQDLDVVVLLVGINDVRRGEGMFYKDASGYHDYAITDPTYAPNQLLSLVDSVRSAMRDNAYLLVSTLLPVNPNKTSYPESFPDDYPAQGADAVLDLVKKFNQDFATLFAEAYGGSDTVKLVDAYSQFVNGSGNPILGHLGNNAGDGLHLSDSGYQRLGNVFADAVLGLDMSIIPEPATALLVLVGMAAGWRPRRGGAQPA